MLNAQQRSEFDVAFISVLDAHLIDPHSESKYRDLGIAVIERMYKIADGNWDDRFKKIRDKALLEITNDLFEWTACKLMAVQYFTERARKAKERHEQRREASVSHALPKVIGRPTATRVEIQVYSELRVTIGARYTDKKLQSFKDIRIISRELISGRDFYIHPELYREVMKIALQVMNQRRSVVSA